MAFDQALFRALKLGFADLTESERKALRLIWRYPNVPVFKLPTKDGGTASGLVWLTLGDRIAKRKLWRDMPPRVQRANHRPGYLPFYSGLIVKLFSVEGRERRPLIAFQLNDEAIKALQELNIIGLKRYLPSLEYKRLDEIEDGEAPAGFSAPAERKKINHLIVARRGQPKFRKELISVYQGRCAVTGCSDRNVLEAAHILGFRNKGRYEATNGILLRADWHTLFDLGLWAINPKGFKIELAKSVIDKDYTRYHGRRIKIPAATNCAPSLDALRRRYERFKKQQRKNAD
jgi:hypothetical protein